MGAKTGETLPVVAASQAGIKRSTAERDRFNDANLGHVSTWPKSIMWDA
jgi:hypothetical protein